MKRSWLLWRETSVITRINLTVAAIFAVVVSSATLVTGYQWRQHVLEEAKRESRDITTLYFDSLNTMMLTGSMDQRAVLQEKILRRDNIVAARVIRGEPVKAQFGPGFADEQPQDAFDRRALAGEEIVLVETTGAGRIVTAITPFTATENTRGVNCLRCHQVPSGAINGAIRVSLSLAEKDARVNKALLWEGLTNLGLLSVGLLIFNGWLRRRVTRPLNEVIDVLHQRAAGSIEARARIHSHDEIGKIAEAFNEMSDKVNEGIEREHQMAIALRRKVDGLLQVVNRVGEGDLSVRVGYDGDDAIGELADGIQGMIDNLRGLLEEKHQTVEILQRKVDQILVVVRQAAEGDLTGQVPVQGQDAIGQLAGGVQTMIDSLNNLVAQVKHAGIHLAASSREIAATAKQQSGNISEQAAALSEITATSGHIAHTAGELLETMNQLSAIADATAESATAGHAALARMENTMNRVAEVSQVILLKLNALRDKAANINSVVTTITKVADQTNLLSLNAAIEAEKAAEHGRGFAVVADEIRRLADQTAVSSWDIEQIVNEMHAAVSSGVTTAEAFSKEVRDSVADSKRVARQLNDVIERVQTLSPRFEAVYRGMQSQTQGAERIKQAIAQLHETAKRTVGSLRRSANAIDRLDEAAQDLQNGVSRFKVKVRDLL